MNVSSWKRTAGLSSRALLVVSLGLPLVLVAHALLASRELNAMRSIYLRERAASIAARLELVASERIAAGQFDEVFDSEPALLNLRAFSPEDREPATPALEAVRAGRELYRTEEVGTASGVVFRAYIPFHSAGRVYTARIDLSPAAPDFILAHARHNMLAAILSGAALFAVSLLALWTMRRAARLERREMANQRLAELGRLSAVLAHEIRNPLGAIKGFAQLAAEGAGPEKAKPLETIVRESRRLESLVDSLLLYGRPAAPKPAAVAWALFAEELEAHALGWIGGRDIRFAAESSIRSLTTDANMLKQALLNLLRNAIEAGPREVRLCAKATGGAVFITVEDDGPGIPEIIRARLFEPFTSGKASGAGLGLSISKKLIEAMGGALELRPRSPSGTIAEVRLNGTHPDN